MRRFLSIALPALFVAVPSAIAFATCVQPITGAAQTQIDSIKANPKAFFDANPNGGGAMVRDVRNVVAADNSLAKTLAEMARTASLVQENRHWCGSRTGGAHL